MPFARPTLSQLRAQAAADINAALPGVDALLRYSNLGVIGDVLAALASGNYGYLDWIARQMVPFTATDEYLEGWAALKRIVRKAATPASGTVGFAATDGATIPAGTIVTRTDGAPFVATADSVAVNGSAQVPVIASVAGAAANSAAQSVFVLGVGIAGVTATGTATGAITGGADVEDDGALRSRMLAAYASPPQGGSITDYPGWALEVPGVTRAWLKVAPKGPGTLAVLFMMDGAHAATGGFPQGADGVATYEDRDTAATGDQLMVANAIFPRQPITPIVYAVAPTPNLLTFTLAGLSNASTATRDAIASAIAAALIVDAVPGGVTNVSAIEAVIAAVPLTDGFVITNIAASAGAVALAGIGNVTSNANALPALGGVTYS